MRGLGAERPLLAWPLTISMLALAGLPATAGFIGKLYLIEALVEGDYTWLAVFIAVGTMISLAYYLRVVAAMWMRPEREAAPGGPRRSPAPRPRPTRSTPRPGRRWYLVAPALLAAAGDGLLRHHPAAAGRVRRTRRRLAVQPRRPSDWPARWASSSPPLRDRRRRSPSASGRSAAGRRGRRTPARRALLVMLYVLLPPVIFFNLAAGDDRPRQRRSGSGSALVASRWSGLLAWFVASRVLRLPRRQAGAVICAVISVNTGYLGYPLTVALLGRDHLSTAVLYDVLVTGPALLLGAFARRRRLRRPKPAKGRASGSRAFFTRNPPLYAAIAGLLAPSALAPQVLVDASQVLVGGDPADRLLRRRRHPGRGRRARRAAAPAAADPPGRRSPSSPASPLAPALLMLLAAPLIDLPSAYRLMSAMPTGLNALVVSHAYGLDNRDQSPRRSPGRPRSSSSRRCVSLLF